MSAFDVSFSKYMDRETKIESLRKRAKRVKMLATDLDGTLLNQGHEFPDENRDALLALAEKGVVLIAATGRSRSSIPETLTDMACIKYLITANGARIHLNSTDEIISEQFLAPAAIEYVRPFLDDNEVLCEYFWDGEPHVEEKRYHEARKYGIPRWFSDYFFDTRIPIKDFQAVVSENARKIENINFIFGSADVQERVRSYLTARVDLYEFTSSFPFNFEIGGVGVNKGAAVDFIAKREGVSSDEVIAFGDNDNDVAMIEYAGIGVATANAVPRALAAADFVAEQDNEHAGVASVLKALRLI